MTQLLNETFGRNGAYRALCEIHDAVETAFSREFVEATFRRNGVTDPTTLVQDFVAAGALSHQGERLALTTLGIRARLLLDALNGADLKLVYQRLADVDSSLRMYELIREGMTWTFLRNINERPGFQRLYFCSPWINLDARQRGALQHAVYEAESARSGSLEVLVITRPEQRTTNVAPASVEVFRELGASIYLTPRLHTKLYIREPNRNGGYAMAIVGSQNLTRSKYLELGIKINSDSQIIMQLIRYFHQIAHQSQEPVNL